MIDSGFPSQKQLLTTETNKQTKKSLFFACKDILVSHEYISLPTHKLYQTDFVNYLLKCRCL